MVPMGEIELGEPSRPLSIVQQGVDVRQGLDEGLGDGIETYDRRRMPCRRRLDPAAVK